MLSEVGEMESPGKRKALRLFVALELPGAVLTRLEALKAELPELPRAPRNTLHLTLRFIGNVPEEDLPGIKLALGSVRSGRFFLRVRGLGIFAQNRQIVLWVGLEPLRICSPSNAGWMPLLKAARPLLRPPAGSSRILP